MHKVSKQRCHDCALAGMARVRLSNFAGHVSALIKTPYNHQTCKLWCPVVPVMAARQFCPSVSKSALP